ncbi:amidohydrolase family protein [Allosphingosinicella indica]|nr:amidohydrolase family protein [Allosphingosinicella indica]
MRGAARAMLLGLALALLPAQAAPPPYAPPAADTRVIYSGATLIDGTGAPPRRDMAVVVEGETIRAVVPVRDLDANLRNGAEVVDLKGRYLLPGLIDSHVHLATPPDRPFAEAMMRRDLYGGITAVRDMADDLRQIADLARASRVGEMPGPDIFFAAVMAGPSFFDDPRTRAVTAGAEPGHVPWMQAIDDATDLPLAVAMARGTGATAIKIYANLPPHLVKTITAEAHRQKFKVWAHGMVFPTPPADVVGAGPDVISHVCYLAYQAMDRRPESYQARFPVDASLFARDNPAMTALFRDIAKRGMILDATIRVYAAAEERARSDPNAKPVHCTSDLAARLTAQAVREGVIVSAGTDGFSAKGDPWPALYGELDLLAKKAGLSNAAVIRAATLTGAQTIGEEARMGSIAPGKLANMIVTAKDPLADIANLKSLEMTVKRGRRFQRMDYRTEQ